MFTTLSERLQTVFASVRRETRLTPESVETVLREIRLALLEADVNFKVVKAFIDRVRDRAVNRAVLESLTPAQQVVAIVRDELLALLGDGPAGLTASRQRPQVVLLLGLQGAGKTTTTVKLARWLTGQGRHPLVVSTDVRRPAAIEQLGVLAAEAGIRVHDPARDTAVVARAEGAVEMASSMGFDVVVVDTAGRLHIDDDLMGELEVEGGCRAFGPALRRRCDDRAGRHQERGGVQPSARHQRRRADQDGRRRARRGGVVGGVCRRGAGLVRGRW